MRGGWGLRQSSAFVRPHPDRFAIDPPLKGREDARPITELQLYEIVPAYFSRIAQASSPYLLFHSLKKPADCSLARKALVSTLLKTMPFEVSAASTELFNLAMSSRCAMPEALTFLVMTAFRLSGIDAHTLPLAISQYPSHIWLVRARYFCTS